MRVLALLRTLGQGQRPTVHELAAEFQTRRETIYRDLRVLQDAGYPIAGDERGRLSRPRILESPLPDLRFTPGERDALLLAIAQAPVPIPNEDLLSSAVSKLKALADPVHGTPKPNLSAVFNTWTCGAKDYHSHEQHIAVLVEALLRKRQCSVEYRKPASLLPKTYAFRPYQLLFVNNGLYVVGQVPKHNKIATLAVDRLVSIALSDVTFQIDPNYHPYKCREDAFGVSGQDPMNIVLRFVADQAPYVRERCWHPSQTITNLASGGVELAFRAGGSFEICRWILGWGDAVEVISPETLRLTIKQTLNAAVTVYAQGASPASVSPTP